MQGFAPRHGDGYHSNRPIRLLIEAEMPAGLVYVFGLCDLSWFFG
jgi:hypothetical protein